MASSIRLFLPFKSFFSKPAYTNSMLNSSIKAKLRSITVNNFSLARSFSLSKNLSEKSQVTITLMNGPQKITVSGKEGDSILDVVVNNDLNIKGYGACEGSLSCSTCHVLLKPEDFQRIAKATVEEKDVLDLALEITPVSRLGCQVYLTKDMDGMEIKVPDVIRDIRGDQEDDVAAT